MGTHPQTWYLYFIPNCPYVRPKPKDKYVAIILHEQDWWGFLINSEIDAWIEIDPTKREAQVPIKQSEHPQCLTHDSYVDCLDLYRFEDFLLTQARDPISPAAKKLILGAVQSSKTITQGMRQLIMDRA